MTFRIKRPVFIIAEVGINHNGNMIIAKKLIKQAKLAGADAVKFQSYNTDILIKKNAPKMEYQKKNDKTKESQYQMLKRSELNEKDHKFLISECKKNKIEFISTPYDIKSAKLLIKNKIKLIKIASTDANNLIFLRELVKQNIKLIISTGVSSLKDLDKIYKDKIIKKNINKISLLHCVSYYPAPVNELNLSVINYLNKRYGVSVGFSDHSSELITGALAVIAGARIIEKHFTFNKNAKGGDHKSSLNFIELKEYISNIRIAEKTIGKEIKIITKSEKNIKKPMQKSIVVNKDLKKFHKITINDLTTMRPGNGIIPYDVDKVIGKKLLKELNKFDQIKFKFIK
tara:strand:+ start:6602 stop:7630 length:1029 start_codon:yes stop_codon:yes gene_type:complete